MKDVYFGKINEDILQIINIPKLKNVKMEAILNDITVNISNFSY